ncbi:hypothetical protein ACIBEA_38745 [Streptomyces sp. NPDC051555]|uniref:hypothetical protein n=1 Tax=Streptomyces sp. NPDC051555 TaxID=3365657 RepID=UPI00378F7559
MSADEEQLVGHSYTRARRHPLVIGKLPGAGRLPGGPYTITQIVTMAGTFLLLVLTRQLWAYFGIGNALIMIAVPWGLAWILRYARLDGRDPARAVRSLMVYASAPPGGRLGGRPQRRTRSRIATGQCTVRFLEAATAQAPADNPAVVKQPAATAPVRQRIPQPAPALQPVPAAVAAAARAGPRPPARTGLQALLASLDER